MYLRLSITDRCNLRCVYCLAEDARFQARRLARSELRQLMHQVADAAGVTKIRITGGEPTLCDDLVPIVRDARGLAATVGLTTNGMLLEPLLPALQDVGLERLNISLDAVDAAGFQRFARRSGLERVVSAIRAAHRLGFAPIKINAVARQDSDVAALVRFAAWEGVHLRFIELMAIGEARASHAEHVITADAIRARLAAAGIHLRACPERDDPTARVWAVAGQDPAVSSVGFITTMSQPFCATCDRLRLTSQGRLFTCLMDNAGVDLLPFLRRGDAPGLRTAVRRAVAGKRPPELMQRYDTMAAIGG
jgi:cyclic pyranopterin phosphate synthase